MADVDYNSFKKQLLNDYYILKQKFECIEDEKTKLSILHDITYINNILENILLIDDKEYGYDVLYNENIHYLRKLKLEDVIEINAELIKINSNKKVYKEIFRQTKRSIINQKIDYTLENIPIQEISKEDFYNTLYNIPLGEFSDFLKTEIEKGSLYLDISEYYKTSSIVDGECLGINHLNKNYYVVSSCYKYYYLTMFTIIHEISHSYIDKKTNNFLVNNVFREVFPIFNEFKSMDYLYQNCIGIIDVISNHKESLYKLKLVLTNNNIDLCSRFNQYTYLLGPLIAYMFYEKDKIDPEKCTYNMNYFYNNVEAYEKIKLLKKSDIDIEELTSGEVVKRMIKQYNDYSKKYKERTDF